MGAAGLVVVLLASVMSVQASAGAPPSITSFTPTSGSIGSSVTINGTGFVGATSVRFNGTAAGFSVNVPGTQIFATVPVGATAGPLTVAGPNGPATSGGNFTVTGSGDMLPTAGRSDRGGASTEQGSPDIGVRFSGRRRFTVNARGQIEAVPREDHGKMVAPGGTAVSNLHGVGMERL
jgi:hypothetical protein